MTKSDASSGDRRSAARPEGRTSARRKTIVPAPDAGHSLLPVRPAPEPAGYDPEIHAPLGISPEDWAEVSDNPPVTRDELAAMKPFAEVLPALAAKMRRGPGRPPLEKPKRQVTIRLDDDVVEAFRREGSGWQARINAALRKAAGL